MKKLAVLIVCTAVMAYLASLAQRPVCSLLMELTQRNAELDEMMGTFNDISEGFRQMERQGRVDMQEFSECKTTDSL